MRRMECVPAVWAILTVAALSILATLGAGPQQEWLPQPFFPNVVTVIPRLALVAGAAAVAAGTFLDYITRRRAF
ncbi:MAG: hypothetical protein BZY88_12585 [SAR202 cluster bacterium Io17-Chloro-G9]|nr:MAG: hypothetical protein BZY88_12585 [SAR202 cluster bacterium Io17-Chloro-G9]